MERSLSPRRRSDLLVKLFLMEAILRFRPCSAVLPYDIEWTPKGDSIFFRRRPAHETAVIASPTPCT